MALTQSDSMKDRQQQQHQQQQHEQHLESLVSSLTSPMLQQQQQPQQLSSSPQSLQSSTSLSTPSPPSSSLQQTTFLSHYPHQIQPQPLYHQNNINQPQQQQQQQMLLLHPQQQQQQPQQQHYQQQRQSSQPIIHQQQSKGRLDRCNKKSRMVFTEIQRRTLVAIFKEIKRPSKDVQATIAEQLGLKMSTVINFFMNARRRSIEKYTEDNIHPSAQQTTPDNNSNNVVSSTACVDEASS